jgi:hypothetical protein
MTIASLKNILKAGIVAIVIAFGVYVYLGTFSRHLSDDYCEAAQILNASSILQAVVDRYESENWPRPTVRYSNLFFVGISESLGRQSMGGTVSSMLVLWGLGLVCCIRQIRKFLGIHWLLQNDIFLGLMLAFFSFLLAPNLYQTVYWRSAMMTHFAPLVWGSFLWAFSIKQTNQKQSSAIIYFILFFGAFIFAGFSEPPTTAALTILPVLLFLIWKYSNAETKQKQIGILLTLFLGTLTGLITMLMSPAGSQPAQTIPFDGVKIISNSFLFSYHFLLDSFKTLPFAFGVLFSTSFLSIWLFSKQVFLQKRNLILLLILVPFFIWIWIAASFTPSVYGQSYPVERARFLARVLLISALIFEGILFAKLMQNITVLKNSLILQRVFVFMFGFLAVLYPIRAAWLNYSSNIREYQQRAMLWDLRNEYIIRHANLGEKNITVPSFPGIYQIKELDLSPEHWVNICAASYYGIHSIRAIPIDDEFMLEYLNE